MDALSIILKQQDQILEQLETIRQDGSARGAKLWVEVNKLVTSHALLEHRMGTLESTVKDQKPTLKDVEEMKMKAAGAGWLGRKLWWIGTMLIGAVYWLYSNVDAVRHWIVGR